MNKTKFFSSLLVAVLFASTSVFTSCKDYDDDIKNLQTQIDARSLKTDLESLKTSLEGQIATLQSTLDTKVTALQAAIDKKADQSAVVALEESVADLTGRIVVLETKVATIENALATYATKEELAAVKAALDGKDAELEKAIGDEAAAREAAIKAVNQSIELQKQALENYKKEVSEALEKLGLSKESVEKVAKLDGRVQAIEEALNEFTKNVVVEGVDEPTLKQKMQALSELINENVASVNALELFVNKRLTSLVLMPDFYWEGLEAVEVPYTMAPSFSVLNKEYKFKYTVTGAKGNEEKEVTVADQMVLNAYGTKGDNKNFAYSVTLEDKLGTPYNFRRYYAYAATYKPDDVDDPKPVVIELSNGGKAYYHINPITANIEGAKISFFENDAEVYTRAAANTIAATPFDSVYTAAGEFNKLNNGILEVPFKVNNEALWTMFAQHVDGFYSEETGFTSNWEEGVSFNDESAYGVAGAKLPFIAAQIAQGDTVVTSDYAVVVPAFMEIIALADNNPLEGSTGFSKDDDGVIRANHLYETVGYDEDGTSSITVPPYNNYGAITMPATHEIVYSDKAFDLAKFIETHVNYTTLARYGQSKADRLMTDEEMSLLGLHYEFYLVDYKVGVETTSQTKHLIRVDKDGVATNDSTVGYFSVRSVNAKGEPMVDEKATLETVGREPLVRVLLKDSEGNIVRYGYIKLRIVKDAAQDVMIPVTLGEAYMNCGDAVKMTWAEMENIILRKINMTKEDFEKAYYLDVVGKETGDYTNMPTVNDAPKAGLYADAATNNWMAKRYYEKDGKYLIAYGVDPEDYDDAIAYTADDIKKGKVTADNNWFGRVWYTPHDNSTSPQPWDGQTNVLEWNFKNDILENEAAMYQSNMAQADDYVALRTIVGADLANKGVSQKALSTIIRFINKANGSSVYVKLIIPEQKMFFAYAEINNRILSYWFSKTKGYGNWQKDQLTDTIEVYANVPTPAEVNNEPLTEVSWQKDLKENWLDKKVVPEFATPKKFDKFTGGNSTITFKFILPEEGKNADFSAKDGKWDVMGASGTKYQLSITSGTTDYITAKAYNNKGKVAGDAENICELNTATGVIKYYGTPQTATTHPYATDIVNFIGAYDATGKEQKDTYLSGQKNKSFAAFIQINVGNTCYEPLIKNNIFNVRFLRPINVWPREEVRKDGLNKTQFVDIWKLIYIRDWRAYPVIPKDSTQQFGAAAKAGYGEDGKTYKGSLEEGIATYEFYNIQKLYVKRSEIRSDVYLSERPLLTDPAEIANLKSVDAIPAMTNEGITYLKIIEKGDKEGYTAAGTATLTESSNFDDVIAWTNNKGVNDGFHIYVPISVSYPWGNPDIWTQKVWATITIGDTVWKK